MLNNSCGKYFSVKTFEVFHCILSGVLAYRTEFKGNMKDIDYFLMES